MRLICKLIIVYILTTNAVAREKGQTEITTEDGVEVFQDEKYYLLKKNVTIESDTFILKADNVKINFEKRLYDIVSLNAEGNVIFESSEFDIKGKGE